MTGAGIALCGIACLAWTLFELGRLAAGAGRARLPRARRSADGAALGFRRERRSGARRASDRRRPTPPRARGARASAAGAASPYGCAGSAGASPAA
jgi:hypothetical protein